jgi:hypothetical protein
MIAQRDRAIPDTLLAIHLKEDMLQVQQEH